MRPSSGWDWKKRCAIAVGTIAERTTTVISSENCVRSVLGVVVGERKAEDEGGKDGV
jgi:hypothetical protein